MSERVEDLLTIELANVIGGQGFISHRNIARELMKKFNIGPTTTPENKVLPLEDQTLRWGDLSHDSSDPDPIREERIVTDIEHANIVCSDLNDGNAFMHREKLEKSHVHGYGALHNVIFDIDFPAYIVESSPGKSHLYIDRPVAWSTIVALMGAFVEAGLMEPGYMYAAIERGYTSVRVPWALKGSGVRIEEPEKV